MELVFLSTSKLASQGGKVTRLPEVAVCLTLEGLGAFYPINTGALERLRYSGQVNNILSSQGTHHPVEDTDNSPISENT